MDRHWSGIRFSLWLQGTALFVACLVPLVVLIFATPGFVGNDDYYHARLAAQIIEQKALRLDFPWLPQTILSPDRFVDHHLLFHLYLAPWVSLGGIAGAKLATACVAAGVFVAAWALLRSLGVRYPALWTVALFGLSTPFLYRLLMIRTQGASLLLLIVTLHVLFRQRYRALLPLGFAYAWLYDGFVLLPAVAALCMAAQWIADRKLIWRPVVYSGIGVLLGLVINPYFPHNLQFILEHLGAKTSLSGVRVGGEWYPYQTATLLENSTGALLILVLGILWPSFSARRADRITTTLLLVALLTLYMVFRSRRFIEYFPAFALLYGAVSWGRGGTTLTAWFRGKPIRRLLAVGGVASISVLLLVSTLTGARGMIREARDVHYMAGASDWLEDHTEAGTLVFQTDWDDFPYLFFHNTHNTYLVGLDPTYLERADPELWDTWVALTRGEIERPSAVIRSAFGAAYVVSDTQHRAFADQAADDPGMRIVYQDEYSIVWQIAPEVSAG
jgi:hypothetical protein